MSKAHFESFNPCARQNDPPRNKESKGAGTSLATGEAEHGAMFTRQSCSVAPWAQHGPKTSQGLNTNYP